MHGIMSWLASFLREVRFWAVIQPWERGVRARLGRRVRTWEPGLHFRIPYVDYVIVTNTRLRVAIIPCQTLTTTDGKTVTIGGMIGYRIADPQLALQAFQQPDSVCGAFANSAIGDYVSKRSREELVVPDLEAKVREGLSRFEGYGLRFEEVRIVDFAVVPTFRLMQDSYRSNGDGGAVGHELNSSIDY